MPWSATFLADFTKFDEALRSAEPKLGAFDQNVKKVQRSLQAMTSEFDGTKITQQASTMAVAIEKAGGAASLTERELRKANGTLQEAIEKYQRLGQSAPHALTSMADAIKGQLAPIDAVSKKTTMWESAIGSVKTVAAGMIAGFTLDRVLSGIGSAVVSTIDWAGSITDLSAKVGVSTTALQRWEFAANRSGNTLDEVVGAAQELSKRLAEGEDSTVGALDRMGLSLTALRQMSPEQQFETVASALSKVKDQGRFTADGIDLLGRSFKSVAPTIRADLASVGDEAERLGAIVSGDTIEAMDALGDTWGDLTIVGRSLISDVLKPMVPALRHIAEAAMSVGKGGSFSWLQSYASATGNNTLMTLAGLVRGGYSELRRSGDINIAGGAEGSGEWAPSSTTVNNAEDWFAKQLDEEAKRAKAAEAALKAQASAALRFANIVGTSDWLMARAGAANMGMTLPGLPLAAGTLTNAWGGSANTSLLGSMSGAGPGLGIRPSGTNWGGVGLAGLHTAMPWLSQLVTGGSQAGQIGGTIGGGLGGAIGQIGGVTSALGSFAPFLGPIAGLVGGLIGKLFAPSAGAVRGKEADQRIGQTQAGLLQQYGSLEGIAGTGRAGAELVAAWGSKNVAGEAHFNALLKAFEEQNQLLDEQRSTESDIAGIEAQRAALNQSLVTTWDQVVSISEKYGINLEGLGQQASQLGATTTWTSMLNDLQAIERAAGPDGIGGALLGMADEMSAMVQQALRAGTEIPENWKPYLESVALAGKLTDANGEAITDLSQIKWGPAVKTQADIVKDAMAQLDDTFQKLADKLDTIIAKIAGIPAAAAAASGSTIDVHARVTTDRVEGGETSSPYGDHSFAGGTGGLRDFGSGTLAMLHGREAVLTERQYRAGVGAGLTIQPASVVLDRRVIGEVVFEVLPQAMRRAGLAVA